MSGRTVGVAAVAGLVAGALAGAGCRVETGLPATLPEKKYETARALVQAIPREKALDALRTCFARCRVPNGQRMKATLAADRFQWGWVLPSPIGSADSYDFDLAYAEVAPRIVDLSSIGGRLGIKLQKGGEDVPYAYFAPASMDDAEMILDCFTVLAKPGG